MDNESARQPPPRNVLIRLQEIHKAFGSKPILRGVSLDVERGTSVVVMGGSGTGKSVLIKHIVRLLRPDSGIVWVGGRRLDTMVEEDLDELRLGIGYLFQGGALFDSMTVGENLDFILRRHTALGSSGRKESIAEALDWVQLGDQASQFPAELVGGTAKARRTGTVRHPWAWHFALRRADHGSGSGGGANGIQSDQAPARGKGCHGGDNYTRSPVCGDYR